MSRFKVRFGDPEHGWMNVALFDNNIEVLSFEASDIYPSLDLLASALKAMREPRGEQTVDWTQEPDEIELRFVSHQDIIRLEIAKSPASARPLERHENGLFFTGTYDEICLPFWRALRNLEGRFTHEELAKRWKSYFPHQELQLLTEQLGKN